MAPSNRRDRIAASPPERAARRAWPVVLAAYRRWEALPPAEKERYRRMASKYGRRGQDALARRRKR